MRLSLLLTIVPYSCLFRYLIFVGGRSGVVDLVSCTFRLFL